MSTGTRGTTSIDGRVKALASLDDADVTAINGAGINNVNDLSYIRFEDLPSAVNVVKRRKIDLIRQYLEIGGNNFADTTLTMDDIKTAVGAGRRNAASNASASGDPADKGAPKVYPDQLLEFSGDPIDYEDWSGSTEATIKQTVYRPYLSRLPDPNSNYEKARDAELYNMILSAVRKGHAFNIVDKVKDDPAKGESGYHGWESLQTCLWIRT